MPEKDIAGGNDLEYAEACIINKWLNKYPQHAKRVRMLDLEGIIALLQVLVGKDFFRDWVLRDTYQSVY